VQSTGVDSGSDARETDRSPSSLRTQQEVEVPGFEIFGDEERREVQDVLDTGVLFRYGFDEARRGHWKARSFEQQFAARLGVEHCLLCSSGTAALSTALAAAGIGVGDEVIVPPFTFVATVEAVLMAGAVPVFVDVDQTLCLDPEAVRRKMGERTRAVVVVHMCGSMGRIDRLAELCRERDVLLIEDTAQAVGATFEGRPLGTFGALGCFSFDAVKTITCGEGGAVVTRDRGLYERADQFADHGHDHRGANRGLDGHPILGTNYRISELNAAVGLAQLRKLDSILETQRRHKSRLKQALTAYAEIAFREIPDPAGDSATFLTMLLPDERRARETAAALGRAGVDCFHWFANNWHYVRRWQHLREFRTAGRSPHHALEQIPDFDALEIEASDRIVGRAVSISIKLSWSPADLDRMIAGFETVFGG
jgi:8-amino-3,8-dideoxy-alpha-D-manno-octulosonate transaminase